MCIAAFMRARGGRELDCTQAEYDVVYVPLGAATIGGAERSLLELAHGVKQRGFRVLVAAPRRLRDTPFEQLATEARVELIWTSLDPSLSTMRNAFEAWHVFLRVRARVVHFNISWRRAMWVVPVVARLANPAVAIGTMRAMPDPHWLVPKRSYLGIVPSLRLWLWPDLLRGRVWARTLAETVSINHHDYPPRLANHYGFSPERMRTIYNGVTGSREDRAQARAWVRAAVVARCGDVVICYAGRLAHEKGVDTAVKALALLPERYRLAVIGQGEDASNLKQLAERLNVSDRVMFAGYSDMPRRWLCGADLVVVPSRWYEAFGRVVVEAMIEGTPVVASRIGGMAELFRDGVEGCYMPPDDVRAWASAIQTLGDDVERRRVMGEAAQRLALERYTWERVTTEYVALYETLAGLRAGSSDGEHLRGT